MGMRASQPSQLIKHASGGEEFDGSGENVGEGLIGGRDFVHDEVVHESPVAEDSEGLPKPETGGVKPHRLAVAPLPSYPHLDSGESTGVARNGVETAKSRSPERRERATGTALRGFKRRSVELD